PGPQRSDAHGAALPVSAPGRLWVVDRCAKQGDIRSGGASPGPRLAQHRRDIQYGFPARATTALVLPQSGCRARRRPYLGRAGGKRPSAVGGSSTSAPCPQVKPPPAPPASGGELARPHVVVTSAAVIDPDLPDGPPRRLGGPRG